MCSQYTDFLKKIDPDRLGGLVSEVIPKESCLIFCSSKKSCENVAQLLCKVLLCNVKEYRKEERQQLKLALKDESGSLCEILSVSIEYGVAYHHSGEQTVNSNLAKCFDLMFYNLRFNK